MAHGDWLDANAVSNPCPAPMTRAALLVLRASNALRAECPYIITDHVQNRLVAGTTITLHAVSANELSEQVEVNTTYDNEAWAGIYDLDRALVLELTDNRGNVAKGINGTEVANFDWGNAAYTNVLVEQSSLTVTYGNPAVITNVEIKAGSNVTLTGFTGTLNHFEIEIVSNVNLTNANGTWRYGKISENSTFNASGYTGGGDSYYFEISDASNVNISNSASQINFRTSDLHAMTVVATGLAAATGAMTLLGCDLWQSSVTKASGSGVTTLTRLRMQGTGAISHVGTAQLNLSNTVIEDNSGVSVPAGATGSVNINNSSAQGSASITHNGLANLTVTRNDLKSTSSISTDAGSSTVCSFTGNRLANGSVIRVVGAVGGGAFTANESDLNSGSYVYKRHTGALTVSQALLHGVSGIDAQSGNRSYTLARCVGFEVARYTFTGTGAVTDNLADIDVRFRGQVTISCSGPANSILYCGVEGLSGAISLSGTTGSQSMNRLKARDGSFSFANSTVNVGAVLCTAEDAGTITFNGVASAKSCQYLSVQSQGVIVVNNSTGGGTLSQIDASAGGSYVCSAAAASATRLDIAQGQVNHNGGNLQFCHKRLTGTLTTGNFNHTSIAHVMPTNRTLTVGNTNRGEYVGLGNAAYAPTGILI